MRTKRIQWVGAVLTGVIIGFAGIGCDKEDSVQSPFDDTALAASDWDGDGIGPGPLAGLTIEEIDARVHLSEAQRGRMAQTLDRLDAERGERWGRGERGARGGRGRGAGGRRGSGPVGEPPAIAFVEEASKILTPDQFLELARLLGERRDRCFDARGADGRDGRGPGAGFERMGRQATRYLDLSDEQREAMRAIFAERGEEMRAIREQVRSGSLTREQARGRIHAFRAETREAVQAVMTEAQWEKAQAFRQERHADRIEQRMARMDGQLGRRSDFLGRVLDLSQDQQAQAHDLVLATATQRAEVLNQIKAGSIEPEDAGDRILEIEEKLADDIAAILTDEQRARWDALRDLLPRGGPGLGRGF